MAEIGEGDLPIPEEKLTEEELRLMDLATERLKSSSFFQNNPEHQEEIWNKVLDLVGMMLEVETSEQEGHLTIIRETGAEKHLKEVVGDWRETYGIAPQASTSALRNSVRDVYLTVQGGFSTWGKRRNFLDRAKRASYISTGSEKHTNPNQPGTTRRTSLRQRKY